jgi:hypothetical protein
MCIVYTELEADLTAVQNALEAVEQQLKNKPTWWRRRRIRRMIRSGQQIAAELRQLVEEFRGYICPTLGESVVTPELLEALENALKQYDTPKGPKSPVDMLAGEDYGCCQDVHHVR